MLKRLVKDVAIYGLTSGLSKSLMLILVPVYTRVFSSAEYGTIDLVSTCTSFIIIISMLQMEASVGRYYYEVKEGPSRLAYMSTALWTIVLFSLFFVIPIVFFSSQLSLLLFKDVSYQDVLIVGALMIPVAVIFALFTALMRYVHKPLIFGLSIFIQISITILVSLFLVLYIKVGIVGVFYGQIAGFIVSAILMSIYLNRLGLIGFVWNKLILLKLLRFGLPLLPGLVTNWANTYANRFAMLTYLTLTEIGLYSIALKIASVFQLAEQAVKMTWGPFLYDNVKNNPAHKELFQRILFLATIVTFMLVSIVSLYTEEIFTIFVAPEYFAAITPAKILFLALGTHLLIQLVLVGPGITKKTHFTSLSSLLSLLVNIISLFLLVPHFKLIGVAISYLLSICAYLIVSWIISERLYYIGFSIARFAQNFILISIFQVAIIFVEFELYLKIIFTFSILIIVFSVMFFNFKRMTVLNLLKKR
jgi:O-antigen/teichoic acid export membrane protein